MAIASAQADYSGASALKHQGYGRAGAGTSSDALVDLVLPTAHTTEPWCELNVHSSMWADNHGHL